MDINAIVDFWRAAQATDSHGQWAHRADQAQLSEGPHSFNLDFPVSPYVGDIVNARVIVLGANAGYNPDRTPLEFPDEAAIASYVQRVDAPASSDWSFVSRYYDKTNYGGLVASGQVALINACAYRSPKITQEPENRAMIRRLPSSIFTRRWLLEAVVPTATKGERLVIVKRGGQWKLPASISLVPGVVVDPAPVSPQITGVPYRAMTSFLAEQ